MSTSSVAVSSRRWGSCPAPAPRTPTSGATSVPPTGTSSDARRSLHQGRVHAQEETAVGARLLVSQVTGRQPRFSHPSSQRLRQEGEAMTQIRDSNGRLIQDKRTPVGKANNRNPGLAPTEKRS